LLLKIRVYFYPSNQESILCVEMMLICETPCTLDIATDYRCFYLRTVVIGSSVDKQHVALGFHTCSLNSTKKKPSEPDSKFEINSVTITWRERIKGSSRLSQARRHTASCQLVRGLSLTVCGKGVMLFPF